ncbi:MAG: hypothetical protein ACOZAN_00925 [Patescibacteria group bacterium]
MMAKRCHFLVGMLMVAPIILSACTGSSLATPEKTSGDTEKLKAEQKSGDTTMSGIVSEVGGRFFITAAGSPAKEIESYSVNLGDYVGREVTITGQYSGDTLFVGKIQ